MRNFGFRKRKIKVLGKEVLCLSLRLGERNLVVLRAPKGYIMCGYLDLSIAEQFKDVAVKIKGVSTIEEALQGLVDSCSSAAKGLGIRRGQAVKEALRLLSS